MTDIHEIQQQLPEHAITLREFAKIIDRMVPEPTGSGYDEPLDFAARSLYNAARCCDIARGAINRAVRETMGGE